MVVDKKTLADFIGVSPRMVTNYIEEGLPIVGGGGRGVAVQIDTAAAIKWLIDRAVAKQVGTGDEDGEGENSKAYEDRLFTRVKRERQQLALEIERGQRPHIDEVKRVLFEVSTAFGTALDGLGARMANDFATETEPAVIKKMLFDECRRVRRATADVLRKWTSSARAAHSLQGDDDDIE